MVGIYDQAGMQFCYPDNWAVCDEQLQQSNPTVSVQSPGTAFWTLTSYSGETDPAAVCGEALRAMRGEYDQIEVDQLELTAETPHFGEDLFGYELRFFFLDMIITATIMAFRAGGRTCLVQCQAEDTEFESLRSVFHAITLSLSKQLDPAQTRIADDPRP